MYLIMRKTSFIKIYLAVFFIVTSISLSAQRFDTILKRLDENYPQERLYLQFDRSVYNPGETIWFKAYIFSANAPSLISKTLYTELTDAKGNVLQRITAPFIMSGAAGSLDIPANINGPVIVRAYTKWMLNFDSSYLYTKEISIIVPPKNVSKLPAASQSKINTAITQPSFVLQFFPEGGDLVQNVESRVAFKATDKFGIPVNVTGEITDSKGTKITSFSSVHDGMGTFNLKPEINGEPYKAIWKDRQNQTHETLLPSAKPTGIVLQVDNLLNQTDFNIKHSSATPYPFVYVVAQMNQQLLYRAKALLTKTSVSGVIPIQGIPAGIVQITVFDPDERPIAERIVFANSSDYAFITDLNPAVKDLDKRKKNVIQIDVPDTIACNLSVAVTDADINPSEPDNIYSHILLTSEIKGFVYNSSYYFSSDADSVANNLDLVMMTNGWRRFKWEDALAGRYPKLNYLPENYISIEGQVHGLNKALLTDKEINTIIELKNKNTQFLNIPVQPDGKFIISGMIFYDTAKLYYQFNNDKNKTLTSRASFEIKNDILKDPLNIKYNNSSLLSLAHLDTTSLQKDQEIYQQQLSALQIQKIKTLKTVVVTSRKKSKEELMDEEYTSGFFSGGDARTIVPEDDPAFLASPNLLTYLQGRIAGLQIGSGSEPTITWRGSTTALFVNEIQQQDVSQVMTLPMSDIAMVKIFNPPFFGAMGGGAGGAIAVYLKKGATGNQMAKGLDFTTVAGYTPVKEFYTPDYSRSDQSDVPDFRPTLYWNPFVITDKNHRRIFLSFYNNDITKKIKVIIEGINEDGKLTRVEKIFQ